MADSEHSTRRPKRTQKALEQEGGCEEMQTRKYMLIMSVYAVMPRSAIIDPVTFTINRTGSSRSRSRTNTDRILAIRSHWRFDGGRLDSRRSRSIPGRN